MSGTRSQIDDGDDNDDGDDDDDDDDDDDRDNDDEIHRGEEAGDGIALLVGLQPWQTASRHHVQPPMTPLVNLGSSLARQGPQFHVENRFHT
ncbi:hypothetical protein GTR04_3964 [Trichophyton interdigitale]|nr:hypothetical protein GY631_0128 [Trichophyton interdigitale]KAG8208650.1 hypothetical protein GTR04_3964 [Trichophyton interdigitale]